MSNDLLAGFPVTLRWPVAWGDMDASCTYRPPLVFPDEVVLGARVEHVGEDRFTMGYRVVSQKLGRLAAEGVASVVSFDYGAGTRAALPEGVRAAIADLEGG